jgi:hypothetical protein
MAVSSRRAWLQSSLAFAAVATGACRSRRSTVPIANLTVVTFGDSVLDCGHYNAEGVTPGQLLVRNDDRLFPEFAGRDFASRGPARLQHRAVDGATVQGLARQIDGWTRPAGEVLVILSTGC